MMKPTNQTTRWLALIARVLASVFLPRPDRLPYILSLDPRGPQAEPVRAAPPVGNLPLHAPRA